MNKQFSGEEIQRARKRKGHSTDLVLESCKLKAIMKILLLPILLIKSKWLIIVSVGEDGKKQTFCELLQPFPHQKKFNSIY